MTTEAEFLVDDASMLRDAGGLDVQGARGAEPPTAAPATKLDLFVQRAAVTSDALRALSHEHRLMILCLLTGRERSVGELEQILRLPQPAVSQQLARLRLDDLVTSRRDGRTIFYTTDAAKLEAIHRNLGELFGYTADSTETFARIDAEIVETLRLLNPPEVIVAEAEAEASEIDEPERVQLSA